jgi:hypothetical protein
MGKAVHLAGWLGMLVGTTWSSATLAQQPMAVGASYGRGVDAYFSGNTADAERFLGQAIAELPDDPRPYYFRALTLLRSGRQAEAQSDMEIGARLEARRPKQFAVGSALERVQGSDRLLLEKYRRQGRAAATIQRDEQNRGRYDQHALPESGLLRDSTSSSRNLERQPGPPTTSSSENPFADDTPKPLPHSESQSDPFSPGGSTSTKQPPESSAANAKGQHGNLMGVLGRVLERTVPLPSVDGLRNKLPGSPPPASGNNEANNAKPDAKRNNPPTDTNNSEDPFGGP